MLGPSSVEGTSPEAEAPAVAPETPSDGRVRTALSRIQRPPRHPRLWRLAAKLAAICLCLGLTVVAPGSLTVIRYAPIKGTVEANHMPWWEAVCSRNAPAPNDTDLAFCAHLTGRVIATGIHGTERDDHVLVTGDFHVVLVELDDDIKAPPLGSYITAVGPLSTASFGLHELHAVWLRNG